MKPIININEMERIKCLLGSNKIFIIITKPEIDGYYNEEILQIFCPCGHCLVGSPYSPPLYCNIDNCICYNCSYDAPK